MIAGIIVITGGAGIRIMSVGCVAGIIAAITPAIMTATTMVGTGGVTGITARTGMVTADVTTDGAAIADGMTVGADTADVMTAGAADAIADTTAIADAIAVTKSGEQLKGRLRSRPFYLRLR
jgi:hypothetical protein